MHSARGRLFGAHSADPSDRSLWPLFDPGCPDGSEAATEAPALGPDAASTAEGAAANDPAEATATAGSAEEAAANDPAEATATAGASGGVAACGHGCSAGCALRGGAGVGGCGV